MGQLRMAELVSRVVERMMSKWRPITDLKDTTGETGVKFLSVLTVKEQRIEFESLDPEESSVSYTKSGRRYF